MRIKRVVIRNLKALRHREDSFKLALGNGVNSAICLRGINGSGKTTYLTAIAGLWEQFRRWLSQGIRSRPPSEDLLPSSSFVGVQFDDLPGPAPSLWIQVGNIKLAVQTDEAVLHLGGTYPVRDGTRSMIRQIPPFFRIGQISDINNLPGETEMGGPGRELATFWEKRINSLRLAGLAETQPEPLPNMIYLGAENRYIEPLKADEDLSEPAAEDAFRWLARYQPSRDKRQHIENSITALRLVSPGRFDDIRKRVHAVLAGVELLDRSNARTMRPLLRVGNRSTTTLDGLSAGERAAFIALFTIARWMTPGGVVLIDEPELHQHLSLMRINLSVLQEYVVDKMGGQLIVASHAPEVWEHFRHTHLLVDLDVHQDEAPKAEEPK